MDVLLLFLDFFSAAYSLFAVFASLPQARSMSVYTFWIFTFSDAISFTATQSVSFISARRICSVPTSWELSLLASYCESSRILLALIVYLSLSPVTTPPGSNVYFNASMILTISRPFSFRILYAVVSATDASATIKCSLPTKFCPSFLATLFASFITMSDSLLYGNFIQSTSNLNNLGFYALHYSICRRA